MPESDSNRTERSGDFDPTAPRLFPSGSRVSLIPTSRRSRSEHLARDHELLDLRGALVDLRDLRVAAVTLDLVLLDDLVAAVHLDRVGRDVHGGLGRVGLGPG